jgi:hypothetical protein
MISESPSTDFSVVEARQFDRSVTQTTTSTPHSTHEDNHVFSSLWTPTAWTDQSKEAVVMETGCSIHRISDVSVYTLHDTPQHKFTMENVVHGGKNSNTVQLGQGPVHSTHTRCVIQSNSFLFVTPISLSPLEQVTLIFGSPSLDRRVGHASGVTDPSCTLHKVWECAMSSDGCSTRHRNISTGGLSLTSLTQTF